MRMMTRLVAGATVAAACTAQAQVFLATRGTDLYRVTGNQVDRFTLSDSLHTLCNTGGRLIGVSNTGQGSVEVYELQGALSNNPTLVQIGQVSQRYPTLTDVNGVLYATRDTDHLVTLDPNTFAETNVVGNLNLQQGIGGAGYDRAHDRFYLTDFADGNFYQIDYHLATASLVGPLGVTFRNQGAEFFRGTYYTALERTDTNNFVLGSINVATGAFTQSLVLQSDIGFPVGSTVGLAVIPAPGAALLALGALALRRRR